MIHHRSVHEQPSSHSLSKFLPSFIQAEPGEAIPTCTARRGMARPESRQLD
ncbi:hypothetical protein Mapa_015667 [Marchantia paleacea]|nr:hypothetical protein Mapa_015667 [Marchantia paleacea]